MNAYLYKRLMTVVMCAFGLHMSLAQAFPTQFTPGYRLARGIAACLEEYPAQEAVASVAAKAVEAAPMVASVTKASQAVASQAVASQAIASQVATPVANGFGATLVKAYNAVPTNIKVCAVMGSVLAAASYGYWQAHKNFKDIDTVNDKFETPFRVQTSTWLSLWNIDQWSTPVAIRTNREQVQRELASALHGHSLRIKNEDGSVKVLHNWIEVQEALIKEIEMLNALQEKYEKTYLVYGKALRKDGFGIVRDYKNVCGLGTDEAKAPSYAMHHWPIEAYKTIDMVMRNEVCKNHWWHWFFRPNYGSASRLWIQMLTLSYRLAALQEVVNAQVVVERGTAPRGTVVNVSTR